MLVQLVQESQLKSTLEKTFLFKCTHSFPLNNVKFFVASSVGFCALHLCVTGLICQTDEDASVQK